ncbi:glutathione S-transferase LANCL1 isoform X4 [Petaurus breviceps papuanus]|uniref:glutathione S-transferase LANCL1 isoform X4 n=1 Tax=Petaurus breviceps papuanus TaxID=3040969 RepID=UPI0036DD6954
MPGAVHRVSPRLVNRFAAGIMTERAFTNPYPDYSKSQTLGYFDASGRLTTEFSQRINNKIRELLQQMEIGLKSADRRDCTIYTGWAGIALLYLHLYDVYGDPVYLQMSHEYVKKSLCSLTKRTITFLCGDAGPLAVGAVVYHRMGNEKQSEDCITRLLHLNKLDSRVPDEMLYGRMGYIYALLFVNKYFGQEKIPQHHIQQVCDMVISSGETLARKRNFISKTPLMYEWYQEYYVGAAHGLAGIYYFLMQVFNEEKYLNDALKCADVIWKFGLLRKGYGLCHGAAGNAYAFLTLYKLTHDMKYLYRACKFAEWCLDYGEHGCRTPDTPFSLFEGMAGTIYFLSDLLVPTKARFPAFEL